MKRLKEKTEISMNATGDHNRNTSNNGQNLLESHMTFQI